MKHYEKHGRYCSTQHSNITWHLPKALPKRIVMNLRQQGWRRWFEYSARPGCVVVLFMAAIQVVRVLWKTEIWKNWNTPQRTQHGTQRTQYINRSPHNTTPSLQLCLSKRIAWPHSIRDASNASPSPLLFLPQQRCRSFVNLAHVVKLRQYNKSIRHSLQKDGFQQIFDLTAECILIFIDIITFVLKIFLNLIHLVNGTCSALSAPTWKTPA